MAFRKSAYPRAWPEIRKKILERAGNRCEHCGVPNYAAGWRDKEGRFHPTGGNAIHDAAGVGELCYRDARGLVEHANESCGGLGPNGEKGIVIVLTVAHLEDMNHFAVEDSNLALLCQLHHLAIDRPYHLRVQKRNRELRRLSLQPQLPIDMSERNLTCEKNRQTEN